MTATGQSADLIAPGATIERLATGFRFTEGPVWDHHNNRLIFSDIPASVLHAWSEGAGVGILRSPSCRANGNAIVPSGHLVTCEHDTGCVVRDNGDGALEILAASWNGVSLNSPNDVVVARNGAIYFTDPDYGCTIKPFGGVRPVPQPVNGVYRIAQDGAVTRVVSSMMQPNGLCFSRIKPNSTSTTQSAVTSVASMCFRMERWEEGQYSPMCPTTPQPAPMA